MTVEDWLSKERSPWCSLLFLVGFAPLLSATLPACSNEVAPGAGEATTGDSVAATTGGSGTGGASNTGDSGSAPDASSSTTGAAGSVDRGTVALECDEAELPSVSPLVRLSRVQYVNTLGDLFADWAPAAIEAASGDLVQLPLDGENESVYSGNDTRVSQRHVDAYYGISDSIARSVTEDASALSALAGDCANDAPLGEACVSDFISSFGFQIFRRPLSDAEVDRYLELYDASVDNREVFRGILFQLLMSPNFLYHFEVNGTTIGDDDAHLALDAYELASRLSFHFWQSMPDAELFASAEDGSLMTDAGYEAQVERLFSDPRTRETVQRFWHEWFQLEGFGGFVFTPSFSAFVDGADVDDVLYEEMVEELDTLLDYFTYQAGGTYRDVLTTDLVFTQSQRVADLYGVKPWDGSSSFESFPAGERSGLLTRAGMLVAGNELTNPIKRGVFVLRSILCQDLSPPSNLPAEALSLPDADPDMSTRQRFEQKTGSEDCAGCHDVLNPLGFALEPYDALGRYRSEERVFDDEGNLENTVAIDPMVDIVLGSQSVTINTPVEYSQALADNPVVDECFSRQYFRYTYRRDEQPGDSCALASLRDRVAPGGSIEAALEEIALTRSFRERLVGPE